MAFNTFRHLIPALALCCAHPTWAAREFTPQAGLWMIPSENNGQPGRGFSLDVQGNTAFLQVFNYEKSGAATFHTAVGKLDDAASMTVPLLHFKGGRSFGGPAQDSVEDGNAGNVTVKFTDGLNGMIQFPGEIQQPISRFLVDQKLPFWWAMPSDNPPAGKRGSMVFHWHAKAADGSSKTWTSYLHGNADGEIRLTAFSGIFTPSLMSEDAELQLKCSLDASVQILDCVEGAPPAAGISAAYIHDIQRVRFRILGREVVGMVQPQSAPEQRWPLNGWTQGSYSCKEPCMDASQWSARIYNAVDLPAGDCITGGCSGYRNAIIQPTSGAWIIEDEKTGKPGRGVFLDVQDDTIIVQTSDYLASGEPTFHLGVGTLHPTTTWTDDTTATAPLIRNGGGRYFGGPAQSGHEVANAGTAKLAFNRYENTDSAQLSDFAYGEIALPGESAKIMRRLNMDAGGSGLENFFGEYHFHWFPHRDDISSHVRLSRVNAPFVTNDDGTVQCYQTNAAKPYQLRCALLASNNFNQPWLGSANVEIGPFDRGANSYQLLLRTRDRHGNWLGLGAVNLPGLAIPAD